MLERACAISRQQKKYWHSDIGYKVHRQQDHKLSDLAERKGRIDRRAYGLAEAAYGVVEGIFADGAMFANEVFVTFVDEDGVEDVDLGLVLRV